MKDCHLWGGHYAGPGKDRKEEGAAEKKCYKLTATPIPNSEGGCKGVRSEIEPGKKGGVGKSFFKLCLCLLIFYSIFN